ncbi:MAG: PEP-CTERM sorting domain-containing protein [Gammaproteobacteria bacterium]|nr:PEP-CTERM sorting domain-containing protein [Gammaproteobacteria bacterium]
MFKAWIGAALLLAASLCVFCGVSIEAARAVTLDYSLTSGGLPTVVDLIGTPLDNQVSLVVILSASGPAPVDYYSVGWEAFAWATVSDNLGHSASVYVNDAGCFACIHWPVDGRGFSFITPPTRLYISGFAGAWGADSVSATVLVNLPAGMRVVPAPAALPLFMTGLGIVGFYRWRRKRRCRDY